MRTPSHRTGYLAALGTVAIWTGFMLVSRLGGKSALTPYDILALRVGTAALLLALFTERLPGHAWRDLRLWVLAALGGVGYGVLVYSGFKNGVPAAHGAILLPGLQPFLIALVAWWMAGERPSRARTVGYAAIAGGIGLTAEPVLAGHWSADMLAGDGMIVASSMLWAVFSVLAKRWRFDPWLLTRFVAIGSALLFLPVYLVALPKALGEVPVATLILQGLYQGVGTTILATLLYLKAVESLGPARVGALIALVPVLAGLAAVPLLAEPLTLWLGSGLLAVSLGAWLASRPLPTTPRSQACPT